MEYPQIRLKRNSQNLGVYKNKIRSVELATNDWCIVFDSDNIISKDYVDKLYQYHFWDINCIYSPDFAMPEFDYTQFAGKTVDKQNVKEFTRLKMFDCWINTMNYFVNRKTFISVSQDEVIPNAADSMYINYLLLKKGISIFTVPEMRYIHTVHQESNYVKACYNDRHLLTTTLKSFRDGIQ
jgi:glycosyltransferase involved in cell wall biosynthesis